MKNYFDKIEDYIKGKLPISEKELFEKQVLVDTDLANELALKRLELESYELLVETSLRRNMTNWHQERKALLEHEATQPMLLRVARSNSFQWAAAASVLLIAGIAYWNSHKTHPLISKEIAKKDTIRIESKPVLIDTTHPSKIAIEETLKNTPKKLIPKNKVEGNRETPKNPNDNQNLPQKQLETQSNHEPLLALVEDFSTPPDFGVLRGDSQDSIFSAAISFLKTNQYDKAQPLLQSVKTTNTVKLFLGFAYLKTRDFDKATPLLEELSNNKNFNLKETAQWYLILTYLGHGKRTLAQPLLDKIAQDEDHTFNTKCRALLEKLK